MFESILLLALTNAPPAVPAPDTGAAPEPAAIETSAAAPQLELLYEMPPPDGSGPRLRETRAPLAAPNSFDVRWGWVFAPEDQALPGSHPLRSSWRRHLMF
ncbi:MAG: hypothetical protein ACU85V_07560 [Gammaproteobacteria bacterium]